MPDREKVIKAVEYLNWYFTQDDGTADKNAVKAWEILLQDQEPVKPKANDEAIRVKYNCGVCGYLVGFVSTIHDDMQYRAKFCPECGRKVLWHAAD